MVVGAGEWGGRKKKVAPLWAFFGSLSLLAWGLAGALNKSQSITGPGCCSATNQQCCWVFDVAIWKRTHTYTHSAGTAAQGEAMAASQALNLLFLAVSCECRQQNVSSFLPEFSPLMQRNVCHCETRVPRQTPAGFFFFLLQSHPFIGVT